MLRSPLDEFLSGELNDYIRTQILTAIERMQTGKRYFTYNAFNVLLDADTATATVEDEFSIDRQSTVSLHEFQKLLRDAEGL
ncbi:hypothetical protein M8J71_08950 [Pseudarthrobacter sp. R1]|uniref:hypothetical protein n=1 Tax=Pseudarthrobacter sp. R1 TaxID=2944934 RepID=UPI00210AE0F3|nr:hypothetical protein [Pseudarthrobacter sp. R1]MCQ6270603.1 hypothetical protein [Pseudarthrobacter sp. R1]